MEVSDIVKRKHGIWFVRSDVIVFQTFFDFSSLNFSNIVSIYWFYSDVTLEISPFLYLNYWNQLRYHEFHYFVIIYSYGQYITGRVVGYCTFRVAFPIFSIEKIEKRNPLSSWRVEFLFWELDRKDWCIRLSYWMDRNMNPICRRLEIEITSS